MLRFVGQVVLDVPQDFLELSDSAIGNDPSKREQQLSENRGVIFRQIWMFSNCALRYTDLAKIAKCDTFG